MTKAQARTAAAVLRSWSREAVALATEHTDDADMSAKILRERDACLAAAKFLTAKSKKEKR